MDLFGTITSFGKVFPIVSRALLGIAIITWGTSIGLSIADRQYDDEKIKSEGIRWQDITPTCDVVISDIAKEQAQITKLLNECQNDNSSVKDLDKRLLISKKTLRMINIDSIEDPVIKDALLDLRRRQIDNYTIMRKNLRPFLNDEEDKIKILTDDEKESLTAFVKESTGRLDSFSDQMAKFTVKANILPDEIENDSARSVIFPKL